MFIEGVAKLRLKQHKGLQDINRALAVDRTIFQAYLMRAAYYGVRKQVQFTSCYQFYDFTSCDLYYDKSYNDLDLVFATLFDLNTYEVAEENHVRRFHVSELWSL